MAAIETLDTRDELGAVVASAPIPALVAVWSDAGPTLVVHPCQGRRVLGRSGGGADLAIDDGLCSRRHAVVEVEGGRARIVDAGSRNGVRVGGVRRDSADLVDGTLVRIGHTIFLFVADGRALAGGFAREGGALLGPRERATWARIERSVTLGTHLLVRGESGTGKELAARAYHRAGGAGERPFVAVNCAAVPTGVAERLLFGTQRGAYSGASADAVGYVQAAHGGTLFLDELGELELEVQAKLLRFLESGEVMPLGAVRPLRLDVRVCLATHRDLREAVLRRTFREDLYYRIAEPSVTIPPLRERRESIPWLVQDVVEALGRRAHASFVEAVLLRRWPGNIRELRMAVRAAVGEAELAGNEVVAAGDLAAHAGVAVTGEAEGGAAAVGGGASGDGSSARGSAEERRSLGPADDEAVRAALASHGGNVSQAARALGVHRNQVRRWLARHGAAGGEEEA